MKIGVLGLGSIGMRHAKNLIAMGHEVAGYDSDEGKMQALQGPILTPTRDYAIGASDAVVIASPTRCHAIDLVDCIRAGRHVFIEKPIIGNIPHPSVDLRDALSAARDRNLVVFVGYNLRFHGSVIQAKKWIAGGRIGKPIWGAFTCAQYNNRADYLRDGVILNWSHEIDLALHLLGPAKVATAHARVIAGKEDIADIILEHASGATSNIHLDYVTRPELRRSTVSGPDGTVVIDLIENRMASVRTSDGHTSALCSAESWDEDYKTEMQAFLDRIITGEVQDPGASGDDGLAALNVCLAARRIVLA